jgi:effector-binding domain-containing protein
VFASELIQQDRGQATVFIPVPGRVHPIGRVTPLVIPAAELAIISHHGSLADADLSYATLGSYATTHEISINGRRRTARTATCSRCRPARPLPIASW